MNSRLKTYHPRSKPFSYGTLSHKCLSLLHECFFKHGPQKEHTPTDFIYNNSYITDHPNVAYVVLCIIYPLVVVRPTDKLIDQHKLIHVKQLAQLKKLCIFNFHGVETN